MKRCHECGWSLPGVAGITADGDRGEIIWNGLRLVGLTGTEFALFEALLDAAGRRMSKVQLMDAIYGDKPDIDQPDWKIIDVFVCKLNKKLRAFGAHGPVVVNSWGQGYYLQPPHDTVYATNADFGNAFDMKALEAACGFIRNEKGGVRHV